MHLVTGYPTWLAYDVSLDNARYNAVISWTIVQETYDHDTGLVLSSSELIRKFLSEQYTHRSRGHCVTLGSPLFLHCAGFLEI